MKYNDLPRGVPCSAPGMRTVFCRFSENSNILSGNIFEMGTGRLSHVTELCLDPFNKTEFGIVNHRGEIEQ